MLNAFRNKLETLASDPADPFRAAIIARAGARDAVRYEKPLRDMILAMPRLLAQISLWSRDLGLPEPLRRAQIFALAYIYNPEDFLPEKDSGLFGFVDDAYLVTSVFHRTLEEVGPAGLRPLVDDNALAMRVPDWVRLTRQLLPDVTEKMDHLLEQQEGVKTRGGARRHRPAPAPARAPGKKASAP